MSCSYVTSKGGLQVESHIDIKVITYFDYFK